jgi:hypothetical protein
VNPIFRAAVDIQRFCQSHSWRFCFIGALAVIRWGEPRLTQDVDLTILTGFGNEEPYIDALLGQFSARRSDSREFAMRYRVVLIKSGTVPIDVALGAMPFEERAVGRASAFDVSEDAAIQTCGAEDLIVLKAFAGRDKDWLDIEGIVTRQTGRLDRQMILDEAGPLLELKGAAEEYARLTRVLGSS